MKIRSLGRYEVRAELGRGTMGIVYRGYDPVLDREIALKAVDLPGGLDPERRSKFLERFFLEAKIAGKLIHPNIVVTHDAATDETTEIPFIAMELLLGDSLHARLQRGALAWKDALSLAEPLARALHYAHQTQVVHRDIKPANVLLTVNGVPKIADFGIAKLPGSHLTQSGKIMGTPYFMSPEQIQGDEVDGRSDLFSLGALVYNLLTGVPPFRGKDLASITQQVLYKSPTPPSELVKGVPDRVDGVLARAMAKSREERYRSGDELADDLLRLLQGDASLRPMSFGEKTVESTPGRAEVELDLHPDPESQLDPKPEPEHERTPSESSSSGCLVALILVAVLVAGGFYRRDALSLLVSSLGEHRAEVDRREAVRVEAAALLREAKVQLERGELDDSAELIDRALAASRDAHDGPGEATGLLWRGRLQAERGTWSQARADLDASATVYAIYGSPDGEATALAALADLERDLGHFDVAAALYDRAAPRVDTRFGRALMTLMQGQLEEAERNFAESGAWPQAGAVALARGDADAARSAWSKAAPSPELERFRGFAALVAGDIDEARRLLGSELEESIDEAALPWSSDGPSLLQLMFRPESPTPRSDEWQRRLP